MEKDFDNWNLKKKSLEGRDKKFLFNESEVWWCSVGLNVSVESCGKGAEFQRPVLVLKKLSKNSFIGIPLSTQEKTWYMVYRYFHTWRKKIRFAVPSKNVQYKSFSAQIGNIR